MPTMPPPLSAEVAQGSYTSTTSPIGWLGYTQPSQAVSRCTRRKTHHSATTLLVDVRFTRGRPRSRAAVLPRQSIATIGCPRRTVAPSRRRSARHDRAPTLPQRRLRRSGRPGFAASTAPNTPGEHVARPRGRQPSGPRIHGDDVSVGRRDQRAGSFEQHGAPEPVRHVLRGLRTILLGRGDAEALLQPCELARVRRHEERCRRPLGEIERSGVDDDGRGAGEDVAQRGGLRGAAVRRGRSPSRSTQASTPARPVSAPVTVSGTPGEHGIGNPAPPRCSGRNRPLRAMRPRRRGQRLRDRRAIRCEEPPHRGRTCRRPRWAHGTTAPCRRVSTRALRP